MMSKSNQQTTFLIRPDAMKLLRSAAKQADMSMSAYLTLLIRQHAGGPIQFADREVKGTKK